MFTRKLENVMLKMLTHIDVYLYKQWTLLSISGVFFEGVCFLSVIRPLGGNLKRELTKIFVQ